MINAKTAAVDTSATSGRARWMRRLAVLTAILSVVGLIGFAAIDEPGVTAAEVGVVVLSPARPNRPVSLRDRLVAGLRARLKSEIAYIDKVVAEVQAGRLPQRLVDQTYFWARRTAVDPRRGRPRRPILYFQPAMRARANRLGVTL